MENSLNKAELCKKFNLTNDAMSRVLSYLELPSEIKIATNYKKVPYYNQESVNKIEEFLKDKTSNDVANFFKNLTKLKKGYSIPMIAEELNCDRCAVISIIKILNLHYLEDKQNFYTKEEKDKIINERLKFETHDTNDLIQQTRNLKTNKILLDYYNRGIELMRISDVAEFFGFPKDKFIKIVKENNCKIYTIENTYYMDTNECELKIDLSEYIITKNHSKGEDYVEKYLQKLGVIYYKEYRFNECKYKKKLPFDFYIPNLSLCIEVDGKQHISGTFNDKENKDFKIRDDIKTKFCKDNDIKLIRVAWGHNHIHTYENIENYLDDKFDKILSAI